MKIPFIDHHVHTNFSPDADPEATMKRYIDKAKRIGRSGMMFTDHVDMDTPVELFFEYPDYNQYKAKIDALNEPAFFVGMGVEIGYLETIKAKLSEFIHSHPFDFVIASLHLGDGLDFYNNDFFIGKTQKEAYQRYFELMLEMVENFRDYDVVGHLDYIIRYGNYDTKNYQYSDYKALIDAILKAIIKNNKGLEINTSGFRYGLGVTHPSVTLLKRYKALGGKIITLGSDAHKVADFEADFDHAVALLKKAGFSDIAVFKKRKPTFYKV